tara:strand:- start:249 stop:827 length:579 start_codon:yes stop_codon:yes gene_type:complete
MSQETPFIIYAESTPNPTVMKFVSNKLLTTTSKEALSVDETSSWPLLKKIFSFPFVQEIFISNNYISIKKHEVVKWDAITNQVRIFIQEQLNNGVEIFDLKEIRKNDSSKKNTKSEFEKEVENIININIKPNIQMDGGDIELVSCKNKIVKVFLKGACSGCPSSQMTLKSGIEVLLKEAFPNQINEVIAINS